MRPMMQQPTRLMWPISSPRLSSSVEAEAYEADAKVDEADEAIVADEIEDAKAAVEAKVADEFETDRVDEADLAEE